MTDDLRSAVEILKQAVAAEPRSVDLLGQLGLLLRNTGQDAEAEDYCRRALALRPDDPNALGALGGMLQLQGRYDEAIAMADAAIAANPDSGAAWLERGTSLANSGRPAEALEAYARATADSGTAFQAWLRQGKAWRTLDKEAEALAAFDQAAALRPDAAEPVYERGLLRLSLRDFALGWTDYEARWRWDRFLTTSRGFVPMAMAPHLTLAPTSEALAGKRVLLVGEQGIGDQLMFASMLSDLAQVAASVLCLCEPRLIRLLSASCPGVTFMNPSGAQVDSDTIDVVLAMGSLGSAFRRRVEDFPGTAYVTPRPHVTAAWAQRLGPRRRRLRVGLSWRGGVPSSGRHLRSIDLARLAPILGLPNCEFVSLQYGDVAGEVSAFNASRAEPIRIFPGADLHDFEDFAGLVANLDAVVSVQCATVHLAGAIGTPCLAMIHNSPEWRYMRDGPTMPWYRSVRLIRQPAPGDWDKVIDETAARLRAMAAV